VLASLFFDSCHSLHGSPSRRHYPCLAMIYPRQYEVSKHHSEMEPRWKTAMAKASYDRIESAEKRRLPLVEALKSHAAASYWKRPATLKQCGIGLLLVAVLVAATLRYSGASGHGEQCTTTLNQGALHTICK